MIHYDRGSDGKVNPVAQAVNAFGIPLRVCDNRDFHTCKFILDLST
jgi:hypothetical protein